MKKKIVIDKTNIDVGRQRLMTVTSLTVFTASLSFRYGNFFYSFFTLTYHIYACTILKQHTIPVYCASNRSMCYTSLWRGIQKEKKIAERTKQQAFLLHARFYSRMLLCVHGVDFPCLLFHLQREMIRDERIKLPLLIAVLYSTHRCLKYINTNFCYPLFCWCIKSSVFFLFVCAVRINVPCIVCGFGQYSGRMFLWICFGCFRNP